jgi:hypothetical protein
MEAAVSGDWPLEEATEAAKQADNIPDWLLEVVDK